VQHKKTYRPLLHAHNKVSTNPSPPWDVPSIKAHIPHKGTFMLGAPSICRVVHRSLWLWRGSANTEGVVPGWTGEFDWTPDPASATGYKELPFERMPCVLNPAEGVCVAVGGGCVGDTTLHGC